uniref:Uncharacterized protein n=1 Tax=Anopheles albimanus TaxID=7167 RepID=A0A182FYI0_ANOAL
MGIIKNSCQQARIAGTAINHDVEIS